MVVVMDRTSLNITQLSIFFKIPKKKHTKVLKEKANEIFMGNKLKELELRAYFVIFNFFKGFSFCF